MDKFYFATYEWSSISPKFTFFKSRGFKNTHPFKNTGYPEVLIFYKEISEEEYYMLPEYMREKNEKN